ncbi:MAG TPA: nodulation protein NfeD [Steroidobacteraceae bacterium]|nr:nodulation protein NfeD [Steroidobacteraceae bacterium]
MSRWLLLVGLAWCALRVAQAGPVALIEIDGPIGPASSSQVSAARERAAAMGASAIVLRLDTPGGLDGSMRDIVKDILSSPVPFVCWVGPAGARAASAGTYILYACSLAAMAPGTNLGAATPVPLGGSWPASRGSEAQSRPTDAGERKAVNDAVAYLRSLAERRGRNADWAEDAVRTGASLSATQALERHVIDEMAPAIDELLRKIDGRTVDTPRGAVTLATAGAELRRLEPGWRLELLAVLSNPTVAYLLLLVGIYGLLLEGYNPGAILPGVVGAISLLLAGYALQMLPVNYAGLALIVLGVGMLVGEAFAPSFGLLGIGGIVAFVFGSVLLMDTGVPGYEVNLGVIAGIAVSAVAMLAVLLMLFRRARRARIATGAEALLGASVLALEPIETEGWAEFQGERWRVRSTAPLRTGERARVLARDGLILEVEPDASAPATQPTPRR